MESRTLDLIGYWKSDQHPEYPDPTDWIDPEYSERDRELFALSLDSGMLARQFLGLSTCRICGAANGSAELSDGRFLWPSGLSHYVREHSVRLPPKIEAAIVASFDAIEGADIDEELWRRETSGGRSHVV